MRNPWEIKVPKVKREVWQDKSKEHLISNPDKLKTTILEGTNPQKSKETISKFFSWLPGETKSSFPKQKIYIDKNKNKIPDYMEKKQL